MEQDNSIITAMRPALRQTTAIIYPPDSADARHISGTPSADAPRVSDASSVQGRFATYFVTPGTLARGAVVAGAGMLSALIINGVEYKLTQRFLRSLIALYKMPFSTYALFSPMEILTRIASAHGGDELAITIDTVLGEALGVVDRHDSFPIANQVVNILTEDDRRIGEVDYCTPGVVSAELQFPGHWNIQGDGDYEARIRCSVPVDGVGKPEITLGYWRQVCSNGAMAWHKTFTTKIEIEDNTGNHFRRLITSFDNQEGFDLIRGKIAAGNSTFASVREFMLLDTLLTNQVEAASDRIRLQDRLQDVAGNPCVAYGVTALSNIGVKKRPLLPVKCSVGDLVNFSTELVTHYRDRIKDSAPFDRFVGMMMAQDHDLEDLYTTDKATEAYLLKGIQFEERAR